MKASELRGRPAEDLQQELRRLQEEVHDLRFQWQAEESPDTSRKRKI